MIKDQTKHMRGICDSATNNICEQQGSDELFSNVLSYQSFHLYIQSTCIDNDTIQVHYVFNDHFSIYSKHFVNNGNFSIIK